MTRTATAAILLVAAASIAAAQSDPPGRVARVNYVDGTVSLQPAGVDDWVPIDVNRPLTTGDHVWVDDGARAEMHAGASSLRLNSRTAFEFLNLDDQNIQIQLGEGSLSVHLSHLDPDQSFEVDTPNVAFTLLREGDYRIDADPDRGETLVTVHAGSGEVTTADRQAFAVQPQQQARIDGVDQTQYGLSGDPGPDEWDQWCIARERREEQSASLHYVPAGVIGYEDLDANGVWRETDGYGMAWYPNHVDAGWAPYQNGHWAWIDPWGWTWVDDAPWGFAPFHYGRWAYAGGGWGWIPGPLQARPMYAPALVAWVGGSGFSVGVGGAGVAWFALGPREPFVPAYHYSSGYLMNVNRSNTVITNINITNVNVTNIRYVNREAPGAITAVPQNAFASGRNVRQAAVRVDAAQLRAAPVSAVVAVAPTRQSVLGRPAAASAARPPAAVLSRPVVAKSTPPPPPVPFAQRQQALAANPGRPLDPSAMQRLRAQTPAAAARPMVRQVTAAPANMQRPPQAMPIAPGVRNGQAPASQSAPAVVRPGQPQVQAPANPQNRTGWPAAPKPGQPQPSPNAMPQRPAATPERETTTPNVTPQRPAVAPERDALPTRPNPQVQRPAEPAPAPPRQVTPQREVVRPATPPARVEEKPAPKPAPKAKAKDEEKKEEKKEEKPRS